MATLRVPKSKNEISKLGIRTIKENYNQLAEDYIKMYDGEYLLCPRCNEWVKETGFYSDLRNKTGRFYLCKRCVLKIVEQRRKDSDPPNETKQSVQYVLHMMDKVYDDKFYEQCVKGANDDVGERAKTSPWITYITSVSSLPQWKGMTWKDSTFGDMEESVDENEIRIIQKTVKNAKKIFGSGYTDEDYMYLMNQYEDWKSRTQVDSKSQELYVTQICLQSLSIDKDRKDGNDVTNQLKALDTLMNSANLQPKQNVSNAATNSLTFSQLIAKWEMEKPIPEPDPDLCDVSNIGKNIRVWFAGWLGNALGLDTPQTKEYLDEVNKYTVTKPNIEEKQSSAYIYNKIFGSDE